MLPAIFKVKTFLLLNDRSVVIAKHIFLKIHKKTPGNNKRMLQKYFFSIF